MYDFSCDYLEGACPEILERLLATNMQQEPGYGEDDFSAAAKEKIRAACAAPQADVRLLAGGTQTNQIVIDAVLAPYEGVVAAETGHVNQHEAGAIEFTGHKVLALPAHDGKLDARELREYLTTFYHDANREHMVFPGMVYITHPTEMGTLYTRAEMEAIAKVCREFALPLYVDGARLGYGLAAAERLSTPETPGVDLPFLASTCDVFYIGGTKGGALLGEAVVFPRGNEPEHFVTIIKQHGGLLAKGRVLGLQFDTLFSEELYLRLSRHAVEMGERMKEIFREKGYAFFMESPTNQQFFIVENQKMEELKKKVVFDFWETYDAEHTVIRFCTSWATSEEALVALREAL